MAVTISESATTVSKLSAVALEEELRRQIQCGELSPGDRLPTFRDMKARWGVPQHAAERVFRALKEDGLIVVGQTRTGICVAEPQARATGSIGFLNDDPNLEIVPYWSHLLQGVRQAVEARGWHLSIMRGTSPASMWRQIDGVVFASEMSPQLLALRPAHKPAVALLHGSQHMASVMADDYGGVHAAVKHLLELGHRKIGYIMGVNETSVLTNRRVQAYKDALAEAGVTPDPRWTPAMQIFDEEGQPFQSTVDVGRYAMQRWLASDWRELGCTALLAQNDDVAIGLIQVLQESGLRVPEDVSVIGFDGTEVSTYFTPRLTTVQVPLREVGQRGGDLLLGQIESGQITRDELVLPVRLRVRDTTAAPSTPAPRS